MSLVAGGLLVVMVGIVWRRDLAATIRLLALQGLLVGAIPLVSGIGHGDGQLAGVGVAVIVLRAVIFPRLLATKLRGQAEEDRESTPLVNTTVSLLVAAALVVAAYVVASPLVALAPRGATRDVPVGFAMVFIGVFLLISRRKALSQIIALLVLDNGIDAIAFLATLGVPFVVELGASLDVLLALAILGVLTGRMYAKFGGSDLDDLRELHE